MGLFDFLKHTVVEKVPVAKYTAIIRVDGKPFGVANLGMDSVTVSGGKLKPGQSVAFDLVLKDPKENLALRGSGTVSSAGKDTAKISFDGLSQPQRQAVARFLARYIITR
ncbi:hypothetical protein [Oleisolibacter albus]|uniref:hypothetical protein n=1 Tax=Oleisolibacter albus TaxID=2171757 RepID=UPI000DF27D3E|nr:hypothetical protein [Oleisolibacter albus]